MWTRLLKIACLAAWLLIPAASQAQAPSAEALTAARELVVTMRASDQFTALLPMMMQSLKPAIIQGRSPQFERDFDAVTRALLGRLGSRFGELAELMAHIYARNFSVAELNELTAFYRAPTGQKLLEKTPVIAQQSMAAGQQFATRAIEDLKVQIINELRKKGHNI